MLDSLSSGQKQMIMYGAPVVAVFALISVIGKKQSSATTTTPPQGVASADAIGAGQLAEFESAVNGEVLQAATQIAQQQDQASQQLQDTVNSQISALTTAQNDSANTYAAQVAALQQQFRNLPAPTSTTIVQAAAAAPAPAAPAPAPSVPQGAVYVPNPIQGDNSVVVQGHTQDGYAYTYGGSASQAALLANEQPPAQQFVTDGTPHHAIVDGYAVTYG